MSRPDASAVAEGLTPAETMYGSALRILADAGVPVTVGGAYALFKYTRARRVTKDLDLFIEERHLDAAFAALQAHGYQTERVDPRWLSKARRDGAWIDLIHAGGNGLVRVDAEWWQRAPVTRVCGVDSRLVPPEEMIWSKAFVQERDRWDGADVSNLIRSCGPTLDWGHLLARFGEQQPILLAHLVLFSFVYPHDRHVIPAAVWRGLMDHFDPERQLGQESTRPAEGPKVCRGTLVSRSAFAPAYELWGYSHGNMEPPDTPAGPRWEQLEQEAAP